MAWSAVRASRGTEDWQRMLRKRVKWLLFKGVSECLKWSHQRIVCRELGCEARGGGSRAGTVHTLEPSRVASRRGLARGKTPDPAGGIQ